MLNDQHNRANNVLKYHVAVIVKVLAVSYVWYGLQLATQCSTTQVLVQALQHTGGRAGLLVPTARPFSHRDLNGGGQTLTLLKLLRNQLCDVFRQGSPRQKNQALSVCSPSRQGLANLTVRRAANRDNNINTFHNSNNMHI